MIYLRLILNKEIITESQMIHLRCCNKKNYNKAVIYMINLGFI